MFIRAHVPNYFMRWFINFASSILLLCPLNNAQCAMHTTQLQLMGLFCDAVWCGAHPKCIMRIAMRHHNPMKQAQRWNQFSRNQTSLLQLFLLFFRFANDRYIHSMPIATDRKMQQSLTLQIKQKKKIECIATKKKRTESQRMIRIACRMETCHCLPASFFYIAASIQLGCRKFSPFEPSK